MTPNVAMLEDKVLVQPIDPDETTKGGVILPECSRSEEAQYFHETRRGRVVATGSGRTIATGPMAGALAPVSLKAGDEILWRCVRDVSRIREVRIDGELYFAMPEDQVLAVLEGK